MQFYERTLKLLDEMGISINRFENESGIGRGTFSKWDKSMPSVEKATKVAKYLNVSVDYLCGLTDIKNPAPTDGSGDEAILQFIRSLPIEKVLGILIALDAPKELLDLVRHEGQQE